MRFSFNTSSTEIRFHCPGVLRPFFRKEKDQQRAALAAQLPEATEGPPLLHTQQNNRRYRLFNMLSFTPRANTQHPANPETAESTSIRPATNQQVTSTTVSGLKSKKVAMPAVQKSENPPIKNLSTWKEAKEVLSTLKNNLLERWSPDFSDADFMSSSTLTKSRDARTPDENKQVRLHYTHQLLDQMIVRAESSSSLSRTTLSAIYVNAAPAGIMVLDHDTEMTYLTCLVTHPGQQHAGASLVEHAVNTSVAKGNKGHVLLSLDNEDARGAYEAMGFTALGAKMMILVPYERENKWEHVDNHWRLKDYANTKFIIAFGDDVAGSNAS
jgi:hypothetical protein